jgi:hypothetical protein
MAAGPADAITFATTLLQTGTTTTGIEVPDEVVTSLGAGKRAPVEVSIGSYTYRTTLGSMGGRTMISVSAEHRTAAGVSGGDPIEVSVRLDTAPRTVEVPADLLAALRAEPTALARFDALAPSHRKAHVTAVLSAKAEATRARRIAAVVAALSEG